MTWRGLCYIRSGPCCAELLTYLSLMHKHEHQLISSIKTILIFLYQTTRDFNGNGIILNLKQSCRTRCKVTYWITHHPLNMNECAAHYKPWSSDGHILSHIDQKSKSQYPSIFCFMSIQSSNPESSLHYLTFVTFIE